MIKIDADALIEGGKLQPLEIVRRGETHHAVFEGYKLSKDVELDPNYPEGNCGYVQKRTVPGYHYLTLTFKILEI